MDYVRSPEDIAANSFELIAKEMAALGIQVDASIEPIVQRVIHSTADFEFANLLKFHPDAVEAGLAALKNGAPVITDVNMVKVGISAARLAQLGSRVQCFVADRETRELATRNGKTRSAAGVQRALQKQLLDGCILVVGNAPTALYEALEWHNAGVATPALIIGVPVGFIGAAESKDVLMAQSEIPWIATKGRKGGSPVAVSIVNALLRMAVDEHANVVD